jgi:photosystem II stability/assembly factor-like uncharacterized protein
VTELRESRRGLARLEIVDAKAELLDYLDRLDAYDPDAWERALDAKDALEVYAFDDVPAAPLKLGRYGVFRADGDAKGKVVRADNPAEMASFGFAGTPVELRLADDSAAGTLFVPLGDEAAKTVDLSSVCLFRWDEERGRFDRVVPSRTRVVPDFERPGVFHAHVWGRVAAPGVYVPVGLPTDPGLLRTLGVFLAGRDLLDVLGPDALRGFQDRVCGLILCAPDFGEFGGGGGTLCERCLGLDLRFDLPELDLLQPRPGHGRFHYLPCVPRCRFGQWQSAGPTIWHESPGVDLAGCSVELALGTDGGLSGDLYTASSDGGIWRRAVPISTASGWVPLTDNQASLVTPAAVVAPSNRNIVYYADGLGYVYRSGNRGATWSRTSATTFRGVRRILVARNDPMKLYVSADPDGLSVSTDGGATWTLRLPGSILDSALDPDDSAIVYAGERAVGVHKSSDSGATWQLVLPWATPNVMPGGSSMIKIAVGRLGTDANRTVAVKFGEAILVNGNGGRPSGTPGGGAWNIRGQPGNPGAGTGYGDWCHCLAVDPFNNSVMLAGGQTLWRTTDAGQTWTQVTFFYNPHEDEHAVLFDPTRQNQVYLASDGGVAQSLDGGATWKHINNGLETANLFTCGIAGTIAVGNAYHSGFTGTRDATTRIWENIEGHSWEFRNLAGDGKTSWFYYAVGGGDLLRHEFPARAGITPFFNIAQFFSFCVAGDPRGPSNVLLVGSSGTIQRSTDGFTQPPITFAAETLANVAPTDDIVAIAFAPSTPGLAYALSSSGKVWRKADVASATQWDFRGQWQNGARSLAVDPKNQDRVYALNSDTAARSIDGGATWSAIAGAGTTALPQTGDYRSIVTYPDTSQILFAASKFGVFITFDDGTNWRIFDQGLPNAEITELEWSGSALYAVTHGRGLWRRDWCP